MDNAPDNRSAIADLLIRNSTDGILAYDRECRYTLWNPAMERLTGLAADRVLGRIAFEAFPFLREIGEDAFLLETLAGRSGVSRSRPFHIAGTGKSGFFEGHYSPLRDAAGAVIGGMGIIRDVTSRVEEQVNERFRALVEQAPFAFQLYTLDGQCFYANAAWEKFWSSKRDVLKDYNILKDPHVEAHGVKDLLERAFRGERITFPDLYYDPAKIGKDARPRWIRTHFFPVHDASGEVMEIAEILEDVTDAKALEGQTAALVESEERFRYLADAAPAFIFMNDPAGQCVYLNKRWLEFSGRPLEEELGQGWLRHVHPDDRDRGLQTYLAAMKKRAPFELEFRLKDRLGEYRWLLSKAVARLSGSGEFLGYIGSCIDITERKAAEHALKDAIRARDEFLSIASHELKTPLTTLKIQSQMRQRALAKQNTAALSPERLKAMFDVDTRQIDRLSRLVDDMLDITRITAGRLTIHPEPFDLSELAQELIERYSPEFKATGCDLTFEGPAPVRGAWDRFRMEQAMTNLLTNAMKYGGAKPVEVKVEAVNGEARFTVRDNGIGIAPEHQERIFQRFERAIPAEAISGLGLGLHIAKEIVEMHGGRIELHSKPGTGSTFAIILPL